MAHPAGTRYTYLDSPLGELLLTRDEGGITGLYLPDGKHTRQVQPGWVRDDAAFADAAEQLAQYFAGRRRQFDLPLNPAGTPFQLRVWAALRTIDYGSTESYGELAARLDPPGFSRAVGSANGRNPISIIVPCHRVVGADGSLTGYGGGLPAKRWLLDLESGQTTSTEQTTSTRTATRGG